MPLRSNFGPTDLSKRSQIVWGLSSTPSKDGCNVGNETFGAETGPAAALDRQSSATSGGAAGRTAYAGRNFHYRIGWQHVGERGGSYRYPCRFADRTAHIRCRAQRREQRRVYSHGVANIANLYTA